MTTDPNSTPGESTAVDAQAGSLPQEQAAAPDPVVAETLDAVPENNGGHVAENAEARPANDSAGVAERLARVEQSLEAIQRVMEERLRYDEAKEGAFNRLYADLDNERKNSAGEPFRPILRDLLALYDHLMDAMEQHPQESNALQLIREGLLEVLYRADVEPVDCEGDRYDRSRQQVKRVEKTTDELADWTVAKVLREGFCFREKVLRPQQVVVRRYQASEEVTAEGRPTDE